MRFCGTVSSLHEFSGSVVMTSHGGESLLIVDC